jgi:patatin-like phospholipase/acyl hydrolase
MFRILCLDGGGIKGVFTAAALARMEDQTKEDIINHFDLIVGTSTGGILAIGLAMGLSAHDLLTFYRERGSVIFPATSLVERSAGLLRQLFIGPKLSHSVLRRELAAVLQTRKFGEAKCRLAIPTYDAVAGRIYIFKTSHAPGLANDVQVSAIDVALATSAAPTYFAAAATEDDGRFVDGGVWANSPVMIGIVEAVVFLGIPLSEIDVLSVGTTSQPFSIAKNGSASVLKWNVGLVNLMFEAQAESAQAQAKLLVEGRVHRVNFTATEGRFSLDDANPAAIGDLANLGRKEVEKRANATVISERFLNGNHVKRFEPLQAVT